MSLRLKFALTVTVWSGLVSILAQKKVELLKDDVVPEAEWKKATPESLGYSSKKLDVLREWVSTQDTASMMVIVQGRVVFSYGDVSHASKIASARKSVLSMLYGKYVQNGTIDLDKTVKQLGLDDKEAFLPIEKTATLRQLLAARSGVYLPTSSFGQKGLSSTARVRSARSALPLQQLGLQCCRSRLRETNSSEYLRRPAAGFCSSAWDARLSTFPAGEGTRSTDQMARVRHASFNPGHGASRSPHVG